MRSIHHPPLSLIMSAKLVEITIKILESEIHAVQSLEDDQATHAAMVEAVKEAIDDLPKYYRVFLKCFERQDTH